MGITSFTSASSNNRPVLFWKSVQFIQHSSTLPTRKGLGIDTLKCQKAPKNPKQHFVEDFSSDVLPNREAEDAKKSLASKLYQCSYTVWHPDFILNRITSSLPVTNSCTILIKHYFWKVSQNSTSQGPPPPPLRLRASSLHCNEVRKFKCQGTIRPRTLPCKNKAQNRKHCAFFYFFFKSNLKATWFPVSKEKCHLKVTIQDYL